MAAITYRGPGAWGNGSPSALTILQVDTNFYNLNLNKLEKSDNLFGLTSKSDARTNLDLGGLPAITSSGSSNQYLRGDGSWGIPPTNPGTVTRVQGTGTVAGITLTGDVNSSGYLTLGGTLSVSLTSNVTGTLPIANGGTGATNAGGALSSIGAAASVHSHSAGDINSGQFSISRMPRGTSGYLLQANGTSADPAWVATSGISVNYATSANSATTASSCSGNANTATKWQTGRTLTIGSTSRSVDGSANVSWSLAEIGAAATSHTHSGYLSTDGGTVTGPLNVDGLFRIIASSGSGGGKLRLALPVLDTTLAGEVTIDVFANSFRVFENGGTYRGLKCDLTSCSSQSVILHSNNVSSYAAATSHTHNYAGSASAGGAATTATKLATARSINGTSFDGSADITTANWGTARTLTIGSTGKSVNGSAGVSWSLAEIGAAATSHTHDYAATSHTHNYAGSSIAGGPASSLYSTSPYQIGRLGVGTTPSGISGSINCTGTIYSSSNVQCAGVIPVSHNLYTLGIVGNTWKTIYCLDFFSYGTVYTNQQGSSSDRRFKDNIVDSDLGLDFVLKLRPVSYTRIKNMDGTDIDDSQRNKINYGFIAQEVEEILNFSNSNLYIKNEGDQYFLCYDQFIAPLTKAVQEQQEIINNLKARIEALEAK